MHLLEPQTSCNRPELSTTCGWGERVVGTSVSLVADNAERAPEDNLLRHEIFKQQ